MSRRSVDDWRREVFATRDKRMSPAVKVLCLYLADHMVQRDGKVSVPRDTIAKALGVHHARVAERLAKAVEAGYLTHVSKGYLRSTAVYQSVVPDVECVPLHWTHMHTAKPDALKNAPLDALPACAERESGPMRTALQDANKETDPSVSPQHPDVGNDEETEDQPAHSDLTVCDCHGSPHCITIDQPHTREASA